MQGEVSERAGRGRGGILRVLLVQEVRETECKEVEITKFRMEIKQECKTKHDQACNITMKEVPTQECQPSIEEK